MYKLHREKMDLLKPILYSALSYLVSLYLHNLHSFAKGYSI